MSIIRVQTALAAALLALALLPNLSRADDQDKTAMTVICKDGTKLTGAMVQHTGRADCAGRGGVDYAATRALPENQAAAANASPSASTSGAMVRCKDGTSVAHTGPDACAAHGGMDHMHSGASGASGTSGSMSESHAGTETPSSESSTASNAPAAAGAAGAAGAATAATAGQSTEESAANTASQSSHDTHLAEAGTAKGQTAAGGGPGKVWVNTEKKTYRCPTDHAYGKGSHGEFMTEADAKAQGFTPHGGKACE